MENKELIRLLFLNNGFDNLFYKFVHSNSSFRYIKPPILYSLVISYTEPDEYGTRYRFIGRVIGLDRLGMYILPLKVLSRRIDYDFKGKVYETNDKVYPIIVTDNLIIQLGFKPYNIRGFSGYRMKIGGIYLKIKLNECPIAGYVLRWGNNTYSGNYLHQLMEILGLYFKL